MVTHDNKVAIWTFGALDSYTIDLMLEELKNMKWTWHQGIGTPCMLLWYVFTIKRLTQIKFSRQQVNILRYIVGF